MEELRNSNMNNELSIDDDEYRLQYYSYQIDKSKYVTSLLKLKYLTNLNETLDKDKLENTLFILKEKYEILSNKMPELSGKLSKNLADKVNLCSKSLQRKPKILKYPSLERLKEDNGIVATNKRGEIITENDFAYLDENGEKSVYKREKLNDGDYWIKEPISTLESILFKKKNDCQQDEEQNKIRFDKMLLKGEKDYSDDKYSINKDSIGGDNKEEKSKQSKKSQKNSMTEDEFNDCIFNIERIECLPAEIAEQEMQLNEIQERINDVKGQIDFATDLPQLISKSEKEITNIEKQIRNYNSSFAKLEKFNKEKKDKLAKELESIIYRKKDCIHYNVMKYFYKLPNLSLIEKLKVIYNIVEKFKDEDQIQCININEVSDNIDNNKLRCYKCNQNFACKHYLYGIELLNKYDEDEEKIETELKNVYGVKSNDSYYCKICGEFLGNTDVQDTDEFAKGGGIEGARIRTREVVDDIDIIEKQKEAIQNIMDNALYNKDGTTDESLKFKIRIYNLLKQLSGLQMLSVSDELEMMNYLKTNNFVTKKSFMLKILVQLKEKKINQRVLDKLAEDNYMKYMTCDIVARYLVTIQTSKNIYQIKNKLTNSNYIGWPLINSDKSELSGVNMMVIFINQMSLNDSFGYLNTGSGG